MLLPLRAKALWTPLHSSSFCVPWGGKNKKKVISGQGLYYFARNSSLTYSDKCHMHSSSVNAGKLLKVALGRCTPLCRIFKLPFSMDDYPCLCPYKAYLLFSQSFSHDFCEKALTSNQSGNNCRRPQENKVLSGRCLNKCHELGWRKAWCRRQRVMSFFCPGVTNFYFPAGYASTLRLTVVNWALICCHFRRS